MDLEKTLKGMVYAGVFSVGLLCCSSCAQLEAVNNFIPKTRIGSLPFPTWGTSFPNPNNLGKHRSNSEKNGQIYCCNAGPIDLAHLRNSVELTKYLSELTQKKLENNQTAFSFKLKEPARYHVNLDYPANWNQVLNKTEAIEEISRELGSYFAYAGVTWHEVLTEYGHNRVFFISEKPSAFSYEDNFSNVLGCAIGKKALERKGEFNELVTLILNEELERLNVQPPNIAKKAAKSMKNKRHLDIGLDGLVTPGRIENICESCEIYSCPTPSLEKTNNYGFSVGLEIEPVCSSGKKVLSYLNHSGKIRVWEDFEVIMKEISLNQ